MTESEHLGEGRCNLTNPANFVLILIFISTFLVFYIYMYIILPPNLGLRITVPGREREPGRFRGSTEGVKSRQGRISWMQGGAITASLNTTACSASFYLNSDPLRPKVEFLI